MKIAFAQLNTVVGDISGNTQKITGLIEQAGKENYDLLIFPELTLTGYPPEDLLLKPAFVHENIKALRVIVRSVKQGAVVLGFVDEKKGSRFNAAAWIEKGKVQNIYHKQHLPNYGVFDEVRYFTPGSTPFAKSYKGHKIGLTICEDIWVGPTGLKPLKKLRPDIVLNISASPFHAGKLATRHKVVQQAAKFLKASIHYCNLVGGQDELVFDGGSFTVDAGGRVQTQTPLFEEGLYDAHAAGLKKTLPITEEIFHALVLALRDYVQKNGFKQVAIGLSGGIDSALVAALAVEALGPDRVMGVTMPSRFNLDETKQDAKKLADNLGMKILTIPIQENFESMLKTLSPHFAGQAPNIAEENLQARIRGNFLMALSNKFNWLILTTGNKSETSTGYCTLYGDTAGGFAVLKDVLKTTVYDLARFINKRASTDLIPQTTIDRAPTAELKENQKDEDSLGPYAALDPIIKGYVEKNLSADQMVRQGLGTKEYVTRIISLIDRSEYKRRQAPPGIKITPRSFGRDHRMPITNRYRPS